MDALDFDQQTQELIQWTTGSSRSSVGSAGEDERCAGRNLDGDGLDGRDQAIMRIEFFLDRPQALKAVGLRE